MKLIFQKDILKLTDLYLVTLLIAQNEHLNIVCQNLERSAIMNKINGP